jgi:protein required for attachment to host cells
MTRRLLSQYLRTPEQENAMLLPHGTVIALLDGETFELYRNEGTEAEPSLIALDDPKLDDTNHSAGSHSSSPGNHDGNMMDEDAHAVGAANWLNEQVLGHKLEHLVIFAAPRTLGELRKHYHKLTAQAVLKEINKSYTGRAPDEIIAALREKTESL